MESPIQYVWRGFEQTADEEDMVRKHAEKLLEFDPEIERIRVMVELAHHRHRKGNLFHVRIQVTVPGEDVVIRRDPQANHAHEDLRATVRDAFEAAKRQLKRHVAVRRGKVKRHGASDVDEIAGMEEEDRDLV